MAGKTSIYRCTSSHANPAADFRVLTVTLLSMVLLMYGGCGIVHGRNSAKSADSGGFPDLRVADGRVNANLDSVELEDMLIRLGEVADFDYTDCSCLSETRVSGEFVNSDVAAVLASVLDGFSYFIETGHSGQVVRLVLLHSDPDNSWKSEIHIQQAPETGESGGVFDDIDEEELMGFDLASQRLPPPPDLDREFNVRQTPGMRKYGPGGRSARIVDRFVSEDPYESVEWVRESGRVLPR